MACEKKEHTGSCSHPQCPHPEESGYECVDIVGGFCEVGEDCVNDCQFSWNANDAETSTKAIQAFSKENVFDEYYGYSLT